MPDMNPRHKGRRDSSNDAYNESRWHGKYSPISSVPLLIRVDATPHVKKLIVHISPHSTKKVL